MTKVGISKLKEKQKESVYLISLLLAKPGTISQICFLNTNWIFLTDVKIVLSFLLCPAHYLQTILF